MSIFGNWIGTMQMQSGFVILCDHLIMFSTQMFVRKSKREAWFKLKIILDIRAWEKGAADVTCVDYSLQFAVQKDEICSVRDNSIKDKWKVSNSSGRQGEAPGVIFLLTPPDQEAIETAEKLKRHYDRVITLWQKKHLRMRQNMIFATIKVVKSWDFQQYMSMEKEQRIAIRR